MPDYIDTMAYAHGVRPWHGLGVEVSNDMTPEQMMVAAGLNWRVEKEELYYRKRNEDGSLSNNKMRILPGEYAVVRSDTGVALDTVGENWKVIQNEEIFSFFKRFVQAGDMQMETAGSIKNGKFIWALARINADFTLGKSYTVRPYMLLS